MSIPISSLRWVERGWTPRPDWGARGMETKTQKMPRAPSISAWVKPQLWGQTNPGSNPSSSTYYLCDLRQVTPLPYKVGLKMATPKTGWVDPKGWCLLHSRSSQSGGRYHGVPSSAGLWEPARECPKKTPRCLGNLHTSPLGS